MLAINLCLQAITQNLNCIMQIQKTWYIIHNHILYYCKLWLLLQQNFQIKNFFMFMPTKILNLNNEEVGTIKGLYQNMQ